MNHDPSHTGQDQVFDGRPLPPELAALLGRPGVTDIALGLKMVNGVFTDQLSWIIYVDRKIEADQLSPGMAFPKQAGGLPTDVQVELDAGDFELRAGAADGTRYRSPLTGGIQIGTTATLNGAHIGTLGCFARKNDDRSIVLLSNYHVLYAGNADRGGNIYQPGGLNTPDTDIIATIVGGNIGGPVDCAIAELTLESSSTCCCKRPIDYRQKITNTYYQPGISIAGTRAPSVGTIVYKTGIHGRTVGKIVAVGKDVRGQIDYTAEELLIGTSFGFTAQTVIVSFDEATLQFTPSVNFMESGDSGSVVVDNGGFVIGLLFASSRTTTATKLALANPINAVESSLGISVFADNPSGVAVAPPVPLTPAETAVATADVDSGDLEVAGITALPHHPASMTEPTVHWVLDAFPELQMGTTAEALIRKHAPEITSLINHCRPVTLAWQRNNGPGWLNHFFNSLRTPGYQLPEEVKGITRRTLLHHMKETLLLHGSESLRQDLDEYASGWTQAAVGATDAFSFLNHLNSLLCRQHLEH